MKHKQFVRNKRKEIVGLRELGNLAGNEKVRSFGVTVIKHRR